MISEDHLDQAALFALGLLDDDERSEFVRAAEADADLRALADELREAAASLALAAGPETIPPPAALQARLLTRVEREKMTAFPGGKAARRFWSTWVPWAIAAAAAVFAFTFSRELDYSDREAASLRGRLMREMADRKQSGPLRQVAVYQLEPTPAGPTHPRATVVWDPSRREGELIVTQLKPPGEGHDYQLWVVEEGSQEPVSAGLVRVDTDGRATVDFKPADSGTAKVGAFALSLEKAGGSAKSQGPILLLGKP